MAMAGVARRFAFFEVEFAVGGGGVVATGENLSSSETTNPHFVRGKRQKRKLKSQTSKLKT